MMPLIPHHKKPRCSFPKQHSKQDTTSQDPKHDSSGSNSTITDKRDCPGSNLMKTEYTAKDTPTVFTLDANSDNRRSRDNFQSTNMNNNNRVKAGN